MGDYLIASLPIGLVFGVMAVWQSLRPRVRRTTADEQALNASSRARIPGPRRPR